MSIDYRQTRICIEKTLASEEGILAEIDTKGNVGRSLRAAFFDSKRWPVNSTIRIKFVKDPYAAPSRWTDLDSLIENYGSSLDPLETEEIRTLTHEEAVIKIVTERIIPIVGLNIVFVRYNDIAEIRIGFNGAIGAWSYVGTDCLANFYDNTMNFGWMDVATVIHEFGHMLGMIHEHQNPRDNPIQWNEPAVYEWIHFMQSYCNPDNNPSCWSNERIYNNIIQRYSVEQINGSTFDPMSIMIYFYPSYVTLDGKGQNIKVRLSAHDVEYINRMYPTEEPIPSDFIEKFTSIGEIGDSGEIGEIGEIGDSEEIEEEKVEEIEEEQINYGMLLTFFLAVIIIIIFIMLLAR